MVISDKREQSLSETTIQTLEILIKWFPNELAVCFLSRLSGYILHFMCMCLRVTVRTQLWQVFCSPRNNIWDLEALVWHGQLGGRLFLPPLVSAENSLVARYLVSKDTDLYHVWILPT